MQIINGTHVYLMWLSLTPATHETYYNSFRYQNTLKQNKENMASWSDENATTAYLPALKMVSNSILYIKSPTKFSSFVRRMFCVLFSFFLILGALFYREKEVRSLM
jgi:hypothetical protein